MINKIDLNLLSTVGASDGQALVYSAALGAVQFGAGGGGGGTDWQSSIVTANTLSAVSGKGYWIDTSSNPCTVTLPASASVGDTIEFSDYSRTWTANAVTLDTNGLNFQGRTNDNTGPLPEYNTSGQSVRIVYSGATQGWIPLQDAAVTLETPPYPNQGTTSGYTSGGDTTNVIDKFPFAANANATDVGDLTVARFAHTGQSSTISGYNSGGTASGVVPAGYNIIDKFPFSTNANASDVGDLTLARWGLVGQSSTESGYSSGGFSTINTIDKFPFASNANASDVGDLTQGRYNPAGQSSSTHGYASGGQNPSGLNTIDRFPFASNANASDVGDLTGIRARSAGQNSSSSGYSSGGAPGPVNIIDKFPFASNANATDVADLTQGRYGSAGQSSLVSGYTSGGGSTNVIDKFPFATDANAADVGDTTTTGRFRAGQQV